MIDKSNFLISLGVGPNQIPLIKAAIEKGYRVIGIDQNTDQAFKMNGLEKIKCSTYEAEKIIEILPEYLKHEDPKGLLIRSTGPSLISAALINDRYKLRSISKELAFASVRKSILREQCKLLHVPTITGKTYKDFENIDFKWGNKVIKPDIPIVGKKNVSLPTNKSEAKISFIEAQNESHNKLVEVQDYVDGLDLTLMAFCNNSLLSNSLILEEWVGIKNSKFFGIGISIFKNTKFKDIIDQMQMYAKEFIKYWNISCGIIFFTFRLDENKKLKLYEVNPGLAGDNIVDLLLPRAFKKNKTYFYDMEVLNSIGATIDDDLLNPLNLAVFKGKVMSKEEAIEEIFNNKEYQNLKERINKFKKLGY